jgi:HlyD family type I secretion membrane fusion protein
MVAGGTVIFAFFGLLLGWAAFAPLQSAAIAPGVVTVESSRNTIKHLEGGIVQNIQVVDGDKVKSGQALIVLDKTQARASHQRLLSQRNARWALESRLLAERDNQPSIKFRKEISFPKNDPNLAEILKGQRDQFYARRQTIEGQSQILAQRIAQINEEIFGLKGQIRAEDEQLRLIGEEENDVRGLVNKGLVRRPRLLILERQTAEIEGSKSRNMASIARAKQQITEAKLRVAELKTTQINQVVEQLGAVQSDLFDLDERIRTTEDVLARTTIRAPVDGVVVGLVFTQRVA